MAEHGDDTLRAQVERAIDDPGYYVDHDMSGFNGLEHSTNAVLHVVREHTAIERRQARADEKAIANAALDAARKEQQRAESAEAAIERVKKLCDNATDLFRNSFPRRAVLVVDLRAALKGQEGAS